MLKLVCLSIHLASFAFLLIYVSSADASTISMVWIASSDGSASGVGTSTLTGVRVGESAVLEIRVTVQAATAAPGIEAIGVTFEYDGGIINGLSNQPCPATPNNQFSPACGTIATAIGGGAGFLGVLSSPLNQAEFASPGMVASGAVVGTIPGSGQANGAFFELAHITFSAVGVGTTGGLLFRLVDGQVDIGGSFTPTTPGSGATIRVIPEPGTLALLALGLGALAACGRRAGRTSHSG